MEYDIIKYHIFVRTHRRVRRYGGEHVSKSSADGRNERARQILAILLLLALLLTMLLTEAVRSYRKVSREEVVPAEYTDADTLFGYLFRTEQAVRTDNNGPIGYAVANAAPVSAGDTLARVFIDDTGSDKRERAAALTQERERCQAALNGALQSTDADASYAALMQGLSAGTLSQGADNAELLAVSLSRKDPDREALEARIAQIDAALAEMVQYVDTPQTLTTTMSGHFYKETDGYEAVFGPHAVADLTPQALDTLLASPQDTDGAVGKVVADGPWYLVVPVDTSLAQSYEVGNAYTVHFEKDMPMPLVLERISTEGERSVLILRAEQTLAIPSACRRQRISIEKSTVRGLRIPATALFDNNTVFVEQDGVARARRVTPLAEKNGCVLLAQGGELRVGERVLFGTRKLFDGKAVN